LNLINIVSDHKKINICDQIKFSLLVGVAFNIIIPLFQSQKMV